MKHLAKRIFKGLEADNGQIPEEIDTNIPDYTQIEDHNQAKQTMKCNLETVMETAASHAGEATTAAIDEAKDILSDEKFLLQKGLRSLSDKDARVGSKSKTSQFYGYKAECTMTADERIITGRQGTVLRLYPSRQRTVPCPVGVVNFDLFTYKTDIPR